MDLIETLPPWGQTLVVVGFIFVIAIAVLRKGLEMPKMRCPHCKELLPKLGHAPGTPFRRKFYGGWICENCGSEVDRKGLLLRAGEGGEERRQCPHCAEFIRRDAKVCRFCNRSFE